MLRTGNVVKALSEESDHVIEGEVRIGGQEHFYLETQCCLVIPSGEANEVTIWASSQSLAFTQVSVLHIGCRNCLEM